MWKLTIEQKVHHEYEGKEFYSTDKVTFTSDDIGELTNLLERISNCGCDCETSYMIEKAGEAE